MCGSKRPLKCSYRGFSHL